MYKVNEISKIPNIINAVSDISINTLWENIVFRKA